MLKSSAMIKTSFILTFISFLFFAACNQVKEDKTQALQAQIDSLQDKLDKTYKPGLGEFMSGIQVHHAKLWFAGAAENWKLAGFEIGEIKETLDDVREYCSDRPELVSLPMIMPPIDSVSDAIAAGNETRFRSSFQLLTSTCNNCHRATKHEFNVIKIPDTPPLTNQVFTKEK